MSEFDWSQWTIGGEFGHGFVVACADCDWEYEHPYIEGNVGDLAAIACKHAEAEHS